MFIFREKSGLQLVMETIGRGNPQKAGQRVKPSSLETHSRPPFLLEEALHPYPGVLGRPLPFSHQHISQWPSCPPSDRGQVPLLCSASTGPHIFICKMVPMASPGAPHWHPRCDGTGEGVPRANTPSAASFRLLQTFCPG